MKKKWLYISFISIFIASLLIILFFNSPQIPKQFMGQWGMDVEKTIMRNKNEYPEEISLYQKSMSNYRQYPFGSRTTIDAQGNRKKIAILGKLKKEYKKYFFGYRINSTGVAFTYHGKGTEEPYKIIKTTPEEVILRGSISDTVLTIKYLGNNFITIQTDKHKFPTVYKHISWNIE